MKLFTFGMTELLFSSSGTTMANWQEMLENITSWLGSELPLLPMVVFVIFLFLMTYRHFTHQLNKVKLRLDQVEQEKEQLLKEKENWRYSNANGIIHLKSPLRTITCFTNLIMRKFSDDLPTEGRNYLYFIREGSLQLEELINDLPQGKKPAASTFQETMEARSIIENSLNNLSAQIQECKAVIHFDNRQLPNLSGHPGQLMQLFQTIIENSLTYTASNTVPVINLDYTEESKFHLFTIKDNGIGIATEDQKKILHSFAHLPKNRTYQVNSLAYCQQTIHEIGGKIALTSTPGQGTTILLRFPKEEEPAIIKPTPKEEKVIVEKSFFSQVRAASF